MENVIDLCRTEFPEIAEQIGTGCDFYCCFYSPPLDELIRKLLEKLRELDKLKEDIIERISQKNTDIVKAINRLGDGEENDMDKLEKCIEEFKRILKEAKEELEKFKKERGCEKEVDEVLEEIGIDVEEEYVDNIEKIFGTDETVDEQKKKWKEFLLKRLELQSVLSSCLDEIFAEAEKLKEELAEATYYNDEDGIADVIERIEKLIGKLEDEGLYDECEEKAGGIKDECEKMGLSLDKLCEQLLKKLKNKVEGLKGEMEELVGENTDQGEEEEEDEF